MSTNTDIRDSLAEHDIDLRRVDGGIRKRVEKRLDELGRELRGLIAKVDAHGAQHADAREGRLAKLEKEAKALVDEAYAEIGKLVGADLRAVAKTESAAILGAVAESLP